jgi:hypothetical protein
MSNGLSLCSPTIYVCLKLKLIIILFVYFFISIIVGSNVNTEPSDKEEEEEENSTPPEGDKSVTGKTRSTQCIWTPKAIKYLLSYLKKHKGEVIQLAKERKSAIKKKLWEGATTNLRKYNCEYEYTPKQCAIKWKNIKQEHKHKNGKNKYSSVVDEILKE